VADFHVDGRGRSLAEPQFAGDTGAPDELVRRIVAAAASGDLPAVGAARALRGARLLATVAAVLDAVDENGGDKDSHMAVVSMVNEKGEKGLLAFTGIDALSAWSAEGRPVPALGRDMAAAAFDDGAQALVIDVAGPARLVLTGAALAALADELDLARVSGLVHAALAGLTSDGWVDIAVVDARAAGEAVDVLVEVSAAGGGHPDGRLLTDLARQAARTLEQRADIQRLVPGGIGVVLAP
jgi:hypothetical protein